MATSLPLPTNQTGSVIQIGTTISPFSGQSFDYWGSVTINGIKYTSPTDGYFIIKGAERAYRWDIQNGMMLQGALEFLRGVTPTPFTLDYYFWADEQYQTYLEIAQNFQYDLKALLAAANKPNPNAAALVAKAQQAFVDAQNSPDNTDLEAQAQAAAQAARDASAPQSSNPFGNIPVRAVTIYHPALDVVGITKVICEAVGAPEQQSDDHMWKATFKLREYFPPLQLPPQDHDTAPQQPGDPLAPQLQDKAQQVAQLKNTAANQNWVNPFQ